MTDRMIVSVSSLLPQEYHDMKSKAVRLLDLLDDVYQQCDMPDDLKSAIFNELQNSAWVDA